jgi:hypothetical protein
MAIRRYRYADFVHTKWTHAEAQRTRRDKINKFEQIALPRHSKKKTKITQGKRPYQGCTPFRRIPHPDPIEGRNPNERGVCHFFYSACLRTNQIALRPNMLDLPRQPTY